MLIRVWWMHKKIHRSFQCASVRNSLDVFKSRPRGRGTFVGGKSGRRVFRWMARAVPRAGTGRPPLSWPLPSRAHFPRAVTGGLAPDGVPWGGFRSLGSGLRRHGDGRYRQVAMRGPIPDGIGSQTSLGGRHPSTLGGDARVVGRWGDVPGRPTPQTLTRDPLAGPSTMLAHARRRVPLGSGSAAGPMVSGRSAAGRSVQWIEGRDRDAAAHLRDEVGAATQAARVAGSSPRGEVPGFARRGCRVPPHRAGLR